MASKKKDIASPSTDDLPPLDAVSSDVPKPKRKRGRPGKNGRPRGRTPDQAKAEKIKRMREALEYRRLGYSYDDIGEMLGVAASTAYSYWREGIKQIPVEDAREIRQSMLEELNLMKRGIMRNLVENADELPDYNAINALLAMQDRICKLFGVYNLAAQEDDPASQAGRMAGAFMKQLEADRPVMRPDEPIPLIPVL